MNNRDTDLEVLINRYLDGEISAREMEDLRNRVDSEEQAKDLFEQMQWLHQSCQEAIQTHVLKPGKPVEDLIATAWQGHTQGHMWAGRVRRVVLSPFVSGLAAGLLVGGILVYFFLATSRTAPVLPQQPIVKSDEMPLANPPLAENTIQEEALPRVNLYYYTDSQGNRWVIEGLSEERVRNVAYQSGF